MQTLRRLFVVLATLVAAAILVVAILYRSIPTRNTSLTHFDTIIVLGTPANSDGTPSPEQRERTLEGIREYKAGIAPNLIFTGGPAHNRFVEAHVMAILAAEQGIPSSAIFEEVHAKDTIQNIFYSSRIMQAHHWTSAEVVSSPSHLPRAALILQHYSFAWSTHPAPWPASYGAFNRAAHYCVEAQYCFKLRTVGFPHTQFLPSSPTSAR
jgi:uncharacterized SAM-binding protein YcdF (DUF218 family)